MKLKLALSIIFISSFSIVNCQNEILSFEVERLQYKARNFTGIRAEFDWTNHMSIGFKIGKKTYNVYSSDFKDKGYGGTPELKYYFNENFTKLFIGARADIYQFHFERCLKWSSSTESSLTTIKVLQFQPSIMGGYVLQFKNHFRITPTIAYGTGWNLLNPNNQFASHETLNLKFLQIGLNLGYRIN